MRIEDVEKIPQILFEQEIKMRIIATPAQAAQVVAGKLIEGGVKAILNFAPIRIVVPDRVKLRNVDLSRELEALSYFLGDKGVVAD